MLYYLNIMNQPIQQLSSFLTSQIKKGVNDILNMNLSQQYKLATFKIKNLSPFYYNHQSMIKKDSPAQYSQQDIQSKQIKAEWLKKGISTPKPKPLITMLQNLDQRIIQLMVQYLQEHEQQQQMFIKRKRQIIQRGILPFKFKKYSLYQTIQIVIIFYACFHAKHEQLQQISNYQNRQIMNKAIRRAKKIFAQKHSRSLTDRTIVRLINTFSDLTPEILQFCIAKNQNTIRASKQNRYKIQYPSKQDLKAFFNPTKQQKKLQKQKNKRMQKQRCISTVILDQQDLNPQKAQSFIKFEDQQPSRKQREIIQKKNQKTTVPTIQKQKDIIKIEDSKDNLIQTKKQIIMIDPQESQTTAKTRKELIQIDSLKIQNLHSQKMKELIFSDSQKTKNSHEFTKKKTVFTGKARVQMTEIGGQRSLSIIFDLLQKVKQ